MNGAFLPYRWKFAGIFLIFVGILVTVFYNWFDFKLMMPIFAVYSSFLETKIFTSFRTNFADELIMILLISGFVLMVFSKEKNESEALETLRARALWKAMIANNVFLCFSVLFVFGTGFIVVLVINLVSLSILYLFFFYLLKRKERKL